MDLGAWLATPFSGAEREVMIRETGRSREKFLEALKLALHEKDPLAWRSAWVLDGMDEQHPGLAEPHLTLILKRIPHLESIGSLRSLLRLLCRHQIPEEEQGILIDRCFAYLVSELYPPAVKVHAMEIIYNHALLYPELKNELVTVIRDEAEHNSTGFQVRGRMIIEKLDKL